MHLLLVAMHLFLGLYMPCPKPKAALPKAAAKGPHWNLIISLQVRLPARAEQPAPNRIISHMQILSCTYSRVVLINSTLLYSLTAWQSLIQNERNSLSAQLFKQFRVGSSSGAGLPGPGFGSLTSSCQSYKSLCSDMLSTSPGYHTMNVRSYSDFRTLNTF